MNIGEIYYWQNDVPKFMRDIRFRYFEILSVTLTHVYVQNKITGHCYNKDIKTFKNNYVLVPKKECINE